MKTLVNDHIYEHHLSYSNGSINVKTALLLKCHIKGELKFKYALQKRGPRPNPIEGGMVHLKLEQRNWWKGSYLQIGSVCEPLEAVAPLAPPSIAGRRRAAGYNKNRNTSQPPLHCLSGNYRLVCLKKATCHDWSIERWYHSFHAGLPSKNVEPSSR